MKQNATNSIPARTAQLRGLGKWIILALITLAPLLVKGQTPTHTWTGASGDGNWGTPGNWSPMRTTPNVTDVLRFNIPAVVTNVPTQTISGLIITNVAAVTLQPAAPGPQTLTINAVSAGANSLTINAGSILGFSGTIPLHLTLIGNLVANGSLLFSSFAAQTVSVGGNLTGTGVINMSGGGLAHALNLAGASNSITTLTTNPLAASTVNYNGNGNQQVFASPNYSHLLTTMAGTKTLLGALTAQNVTIGSGTALESSTQNLTVTGSTTVQGTFQDTGNGGTNSFLGPLLLTATGRFVTNSNSPINFGGGITHNNPTSNSFSKSGSGQVTFTSSQSLSGAGTFVFVAGGVVVNPGVTLSNFAIVNSGTRLNGATATSTWSNEAGSTLIYSDANAPMATGSLLASAPNLVRYNGANQAIKATTYHLLNLETLNATKTLLGTTQVNANLTILPSVSLQVLDKDLSVLGTTIIRGSLLDDHLSGTTTLQEVYFDTQSGRIDGAAEGVVNVNGNATVNFTVTPGNNSFALGRVALSVAGTTTIAAGRTLSFSSSSGTKTFNHILVQGTWDNALNSPISIGGNLTLAASAAFLAGNGTYSFTGLDATISCGVPLTIANARFVGRYSASGTDIMLATPLMSPGARFVNHTANYPLILPGSATGRAFNNASLAFVNKFDRFGASAHAGNTIGATATDLTFARAGQGDLYALRSRDLNPAPTAAIVKFSLAVTSGADMDAAATLLLGAGFQEDASNTGAAARLQFNLRSANQIRLTHPDGTPATSADVGTAAVWWVVNRSGNSLNYTGPDGLSYPIGHGTSDLWIGNARQWTGRAIASVAPTLGEVKMVCDKGTGSISLRNLQINPIGQMAITPLSCWTPGRILTIPFTVTQSMSGNNATFNAPNAFKVELSYLDGSFTTRNFPTISFPYEITIPNSVVFNPATNSGTIQAIIPAELNLVGPDYRFRLVSSDSYMISANNGTSMVSLSTNLNPQTLDPTNHTGGVITSSVTSGITWLYQTDLNGATYTLPVSGSTYTPKFADFPGRGQYYVAIRTASGCVSNYITVYVNCGSSTNLIANGTFSAVGSGLAYNNVDGKSGFDYAAGDFQTEYTAVSRTNSPQMIEGGYNVGTDPSKDAKSDWCSLTSSDNYSNKSFSVFTPSPGSGGNMLIANGANGTSKKLWMQHIGTSNPATSVIKKNTDYILTFWASGLSTANPQSLIFGVYINCRRVGDDITDRFSSQCRWTKYSIQFNTGELSDFDLSINNISANGAGNDVAIDDIEFYECSGTSSFKAFNEFVWRGYNNNWFDPDNWGTCSEIPTCGDNITIPTGKLKYPIINGTGALAKNVVIEPGASLTINAGFTLGICGNVNNSGTITGPGSITFQGTTAQTVTGTGVFTNVVAGQSAPQPGVTQASDITISGQLDLRLNNFWSIGNHTLTLNGTLSSNPGTIMGSNVSKLVVGGTGDVTGPLSFRAGSQLLATLTMNRVSSGQVTLGSPLTLVGGADALTLTSGLINTSPTNLLTLDATSTVTGGSSFVSGGSNASHINGPMAKVTTATTNFTFPVGNAGALGQIGITPTATTQTTYTARYFRQNPIINVSDRVTPPLRHISSLEYWTLDRSSGSGGRVTLHWTSYSEVAAMAGYWQELRVARYTGSGMALGINEWENQGPGAGMGTNAVVSPGASYNGGFVTSDLVTGFGPFTLASTIPNNPLPVELVSLKATPTQDGKVNVSWITASEHKASHFLLQHSTDGKHFQTIAQLQARGKSVSAQSYQFLHADPASFNYYRLRSVDQDASSRLSSIVTAQLQGAQLPAPLLYPNPGDGKQLFVKTAYPHSVSVSITSLVGVEVFRQRILPQQGLLSLRPNLPQGTYLVALKEGNLTSHFKLIVE